MMSKFFAPIVCICTLSILPAAAQSGSTTVELKNAQGASVGTAKLSPAKDGGVSVALETTFEPPAALPDFTVYEPRVDDPRVVLELDESAQWVVEQYPVEGVEALGEGRLRVRLAVSERAWLERLLLRLGPRAQVVEGDAEAGRGAACRVLGRYVTK